MKEDARGAAEAPLRADVRMLVAIQVELLRRFRAGDKEARLPLMRSIAGIAAALRKHRVKRALRRPARVEYFLTVMARTTLVGMFLAIVRPHAS